MIRAEAFTRHPLTSLQPLYCIYGEETLLAIEAVDFLVAHAKDQGFTERDVLTVESGFNWSSLTEARQSLSLFCDKKLIEIRIPTGKPGVEGAQALIEHTKHLSRDILTVIVLPKLDRTNLNSKWFTALAEKGQTIGAQSIDRPQLPAWIQTRLEKQKQQLTHEALHFLCDRVEGNLLAAHQELQKLALLYPPGEINLETLQHTITHMAKYDVFQLSESLLQRRPARFVQMLRGLLSIGEAPTLILWVLTEEIRTLLKVGQGKARGLSMTELCRTHRIFGEKVKWIEPMLAQLSAHQLKQALLHAAKIDAMIKGLIVGRVEDELEILGLSLISEIAPYFQTRAIP